MKARLIVKGNRFEAAKAAADRGFGFAFEKEILDATPTTTGIVNSTVDRLNAWICELPHDAPFPNGALLLWTPIDEDAND